MRYYSFVFVGIFLLGVTACNKKSEALWLAEREQIRLYFQQEGISDYTENEDAGYFYHITQVGDSSLAQADINSKVDFSDISSIGKILLKTLSRPFCKFDLLVSCDCKN